MLKYVVHIMMSRRNGNDCGRTEILKAEQVLESSNFLFQTNKIHNHGLKYTPMVQLQQ